jgi:hypothetical protein
MNEDNLYLKYGTEKTTPNVAGEYVTTGALREIELRIDLSDVGSSPAILDDYTVFPAGFRIEEVEVVAETVADSSGDTGVLNLGIMGLDRSTAVDADGILAAFAQTSMDAEGEKTVLRKGTSTAGVLVGDVVETAGYLCADYDTSAFTQGVIKVTIRYYRP